MFENPNVKYWSEKNNLEDRKVFHCAPQMKKYISGSVIDMGAGIGIVTDAFCKDNLNVKDVLCIDFSPIHHKILKGKGYDFKEINLDNPSYDLESNCFDTVISSDVVEHLLSPFAYLSECYRILKPGGYLVLSTPDAKREAINIPHINFFSEESLVKFLMRVGFERKNMKKIFNGIINPQITSIIGKIPLVNEFFNYGLYYVCKK